MWPNNRDRFQKMAILVLFSLIPALSGCGEMPAPRGPKAKAGRTSSAGSAPGSAASAKPPRPQTTQAQTKNQQEPEATTSDVDLESLEVLRALRDSWAVKGSKIVADSKLE